MDVDRPLDEMIKERSAAEKPTRPFGTREKGSFYSKRVAHMTRGQRLAQLRGKQMIAQPHVRRAFGIPMIPQRPIVHQFITPQMTRSFVPVPQIPAARPKAIVGPVAAAHNKHIQGRQVLTKASRTAISQQIARISGRFGPVNFPTMMPPTFRAPRLVFATPRQQMLQQRQTSKVVRQPVKSQFLYIPGNPAPQPAQQPAIQPMFMFPGANPVMVASPGIPAVGAAQQRGRMRKVQRGGGRRQGFWGGGWN